MDPPVVQSCTPRSDWPHGWGAATVMTARPQSGQAWRDVQGPWAFDGQWVTSSTAIGILICASAGPDRDQLCAALASSSGGDYHLVEPAGLYPALEQGVDMLITTSETVACGDIAPLQAWLEHQPEWSDLPILVLTAATGGRRLPPPPALATLGNVRALQRPYHPASLEMLVQACLNGRQKQYGMRDRLRALSSTGDLPLASEPPTRLEAIGRLTGGIAQDFNNLLTGIMGSLDLIRRRIGNGQHANLDSLVDLSILSAQRAANLTHRLLAFACRQDLDARRLDVNQLIQAGQGLLGRSLGSSIAFELRPCPGVWPVCVDPSQLESALLNLVINAGDAMPEGGRLLIDTANRTLKAQAPGIGMALPLGDYVVIGVQDDGAGMARETRERAFDPFFTTKPAGLGTGLGLSMVYGFARQSGGHVTLQSETGRGSRVELYFPRA
jgi:signal transduction histidine kinase